MGLQGKNKGGKGGTLVVMILRRRHFPVNKPTMPLTSLTFHPCQVNTEVKGRRCPFMAPTTPCSQGNGKWLFCKASCKAQVEFRSSCLGNTSEQGQREGSGGRGLRSWQKTGEKRCPKAIHVQNDSAWTLSDMDYSHQKLPECRPRMQIPGHHPRANMQECPEMDLGIYILTNSW